MNGIFDYLEENSVKKKFNGVVSAVVTNNQDPDGLGRVKVKFPWAKDQNETYWARVAVPMAGSDKGMFFIPEVDDEVLVAFFFGEIEEPVVIGVMWNGQDKPPETNTSIKKIKSSNGHELVLNDEDNVIHIKSSGGEEIVLESGKKISIKSGENLIEIDTKKSEINIKSSLSLNIEATDLKIKGTNVEISANAVLTLKGGLVRIN